MKQNIIKLTLGLLTILIISSCRKFVEIAPPITQLTTETVFTDSTTANAAVAGLYSTLCPAGILRPFNGWITLYGALSADDVNIASSGVIEYPQYASNSIASASSSNNDFWTYSYLGIYHANLVREKLATTALLSTSLQQRLTGEVLFLRAFQYFYLVNFYGQVPLAVTSDYRVNAELSRADTGKIYDQMVADLTEAKSLLTTKYTTDGKLRANQWSATALLARVYLYKRDWFHAETEASNIINSGAFQMATIANTFLASSPEAIQQFSLPINTIYNSIDGNLFVPSATVTVVPPFTVTDTLYKVFESNDLRKTNWIASRTIGTTTYRYPYKYKVRTATSGTAKTEHNIALRLSEQYLIRAEALAMQGKLSAAIQDIDVIRKRAGLPLIANTNPGISLPNLLNSIYHERQTELFAEWGNRWLDLKRTGRVNDVLKNIKPGWKSTASIFPIPDAQRLKSIYLTQNPGY